MKPTSRHRRIARTIWECGGRLDEVARREDIRPDTLRRWLADQDFRALLAEDALEPVLQATSAMLRWAPAAVARLIQDLEGESPADARQAAREILKLALDTQRELGRPAATSPNDAAPAGGDPDHPLTRRVANLTDEQLARVLAILNEPKGDLPVTLQWIPLECLEPHPENSNRMPPPLVDKLKAHIQRTGLYEPLVVRPIQCGARNVECGVKDADAVAPGSAAPLSFTPHSALGTPHLLFQILNGHHRAQVLRQLGHTHARCDVWEVDEAEGRVLLATLNRLEGRDDPAARARLVARLAEGRSAEDLARLLPEPSDAVERLLALAKPPPAPLAPEAMEPPARPMTFFLTDDQHEVVREALHEAAAAPPARATGGPAKPSRAEALERLALWYLEARNRR